MSLKRKPKDVQTDVKQKKVFLYSLHLKFHNLSIWKLVIFDSASRNSSLSKFLIWKIE